MEEMERTELPVYDLRPARRAYSRFGLSAVAIYLLALVAQFAVMALVDALIPVITWEWFRDFLESSSWFWLMNFLPLYLIGMPLGLLVCIFLPAKAPRKHKLGAGRMFALFCISYCLMYAGNLIGTISSMLLSGGGAENMVAELAMDNNPLKILFMVIVAPLVEEFIFRKVLIDRVGRFGEKLAVLASGLTFGMFHMNLFQFFYAFGIGLILAYIYTRTGRLRYPVILHMIINFLGSVVAPWILSLVDLEALDTIATLSDAEAMELLLKSLPGLSVYLLYSQVLMGFVVAGLVLLIVRWRRAHWEPASQQLPAGKHLKAMLLNVGMILLLVMCCAMTVAALFV